MFSYDDLMDRVRCGALVDYTRWVEQHQLLDPDEAPERELFLCPDLFDELAGWPEEARASMHAELVNFIAGRTVWWGDLRKGNHMKPLNLNEDWAEFKNRGAPQTRIFGGFVELDTFVAIMAKLRGQVPGEIQPVLEQKWQSIWPQNTTRIGLTDLSRVLTNYRTCER